MDPTWNITIDDSSFMFSYSPYSDGIIDGGWEATRDPNGEGAGSYHRTNANGPSVTLPFYGTGFQLIGGSNAFYDVRIDSETTVTGLMASTSQVLYSRDNLTAGNHIVTLTSRATAPSTILTFDKAVIFNSQRKDFNPPATIINNDITAINYVGNWQPQYDIHVPNTSGPYWTKYTNSSAAYFTFEFTGSAVLVYGSSNNDHSRYSAAIDSASPHIYNATVAGYLGNAIMYYADGLDGSQPHTINVANIDDGPKLSLSYIETYNDILSSSPAPTPAPAVEEHHKSNVGIIVGPVVAVVAVIALAIAAFLWFRRRKQHAASDEFLASAPQGPVYSGDKGRFNPPFELSNMMLPRPYTQFYEAVNPSVEPQQERLYPHSYIPRPSESEVSSNPPTESSRQPQTDVDIDIIMQMIAQRIDSPRDVDAPLPQYRAQ